MVPATLSGRRTLLYLAAVLFGAATTLYSILWRYYDEFAGLERVGIEFTYSLASRSLKITRVLQGWNTTLE